MKLLVFLYIILPSTILAVSLDSFIKEGGNEVNLTHSLRVIAEFSPTHVARNLVTTLTIYGQIRNGFHIYSILPQGEFSPEPTQLILDSEQLKPISSTEESPVKSIIDETFNLPLKVHKNEFWLKQKYRVSNDIQKGTYQFKGYVKYQVCNNKICSLPLKANFQEKLDITE